MAKESKRNPRDGKRRRLLVPVIIIGAVIAVVLALWLLGYRDVPDDPGNVYIADRVFGDLEQVAAGDRIWLFPFGGELISLPLGINEVRQDISVPTADGELKLTLEVDLEFDIDGALAGVERWEAAFPEAMIAELAADALAGYAFDGTTAELYGDRRGETAELLRQGLGTALAAFSPGVELDRLALTQAPDYEQSEYNPPKVIILGIDALDDELLAKLMDRGELPHFQKLRDEGYLDVLESEPPYFSPIVWTTLATGKPVAEHGIDGFVTYDDNGLPQPLSAADRKVSAFWEYLGAYDMNSISVNWFYTWPTGEADGYVLTNYAWEPKFGKGFSGIEDFESLSGKAWPADILDEVNAAIADEPYISTADYPPAPLLAEVPAAATDGKPLPSGPPLPHYLERDIDSANAMFHLMDTREWDIAAVYQEFPDVLCHLTWPAHAHYWERLTGEPCHLAPIPPERRELAERIGDMVVESYRLTDKLLGVAMERWGDKAVIVVVSDHGFDTIHPPEEILIGDDEYSVMAYWHDPDGVFGVWGPHVRRGAVGNGVDIYEFLPTVLALAGVPAAADMPGEVVEEVFEPGYLAWLRTGLLADPPATWDPETREVEAELSESLSAAELERLRALGYLQ